MTTNKLKDIVSHLWKYKEYLLYNEEFDYPFYGGLKRRMGVCSPEAVDAMQNIWSDFCQNKFGNKKEFLSRYKAELVRLGEQIK